METKHFESLYPVDTRSAEIERVLNYIKQGSSCQVIALPGVGRSTILGLLTHNREVRKKHLGEQAQQFHFVLTNFSEVRRRPLLDVNKFLFLNLVDSLRERRFEDAYTKTHAIFKESLAFEDELVLFQGLKNAIDILAAEKNLTIVFLFDRFEEYIPMVTADFFANLRVLRNRAKFQFAAVFSLMRPLEESIEPSLMTEFYDFVVGHTIYLPIVDDPGLTFRLKHLEQAAGKTIPESVVQHILHLSGKFTREAKTCFHSLLASEAPYPQSEAELEQFLLAHKPVQRPLFEIWQSLTPSEQAFLLSEEYSTSHQDYAYLAHVGLLKDGKVTIPLFMKFLKQYITTDSMLMQKKEPILFDTNTNEIKRGTAILSDNLTSSEFRLLSHLLQHPERIIEREEIIGIVWSDAASTAGVTDQALDQLIFRLRKKIEADPTNPQHLQTVKGRGYKLIP